jgi:hypothetical protein
VFENRVLRRIFGPKREEETGGWRKVHNEELHNLYSSPSIIRMNKPRKMRWAVHVTQIWKNRNTYRISVRRLVKHKNTTHRTDGATKRKKYHRK